MADIQVVVSSDIKKSSVLINPKVHGGDVYDPGTNTLTEGNNVLAEGPSSLAALRKYYGRN